MWLGSRQDIRCTHVGRLTYAPASVQLLVDIHNRLQGCSIQSAAPADIEVAQAGEVLCQGLHGVVRQAPAAVQPQRVQLRAALRQRLYRLISHLNP